MISCYAYNYRELIDGSVEDNEISKDSQLTLALRIQTGMKVCAVLRVLIHSYDLR